MTALLGKNQGVGWEVAPWEHKIVSIWDLVRKRQELLATAPDPWCDVFTGQEEQLNHCCSASPFACSWCRNQCTEELRHCSASLCFLVLYFSSPYCPMSLYALSCSAGGLPMELPVGLRAREFSPGRPMVLLAPAIDLRAVPEFLLYWALHLHLLSLW